MLSSPASLAANRVNAARSTGLRTAEGKSASSTGSNVRVSLSQGAYAADETLLAGSAAQLSTGESHTPDKNEATSIDGPALLASCTNHYTPAGPAETLLVRRIVAASLRLDLLASALDALLELGERRALVDHLAERFVVGRSTMQVRDQPSWAAMLRRYDGTADPPPDYDLSLDPDPALCTLAYTLSGPRAAALMRHEATAERRLHASMRELHRLQAARRKQDKERNEPTTLHATTARYEAIAAHTAAPWKEAIPDPAMDPHHITRNEVLWPRAARERDENGVEWKGPAARGRAG